MVTGYGFDMLYAGPREAVLHAVFRIYLLKTLRLENPVRSGQQSHPDAGILDDGEVAFPIGAAHHGCADKSRSSLRRGRRYPEKDDPGRCRKTASKRQFAEILVEGHHDAPFVLGDRKHLFISDARIIGTNPHDIIALVSKRRHSVAEKVLVGEQTHRSGLGEYEGIDLLGFE